MKKYREIILIAILLTGTGVTLGFYVAAEAESLPESVASGSPPANTTVASVQIEKPNEAMQLEREIQNLGTKEIFKALIPPPTPTPAIELPPIPNPRIDAVLKSWNLVGFNGSRSITIRNGANYFEFNLAEIREIEYGKLTLAVRLDKIDDEKLVVEFHAPENVKDEEWRQVLKVWY